jgi:hypothetical protein
VRLADSSGRSNRPGKTCGLNKDYIFYELLPVDHSPPYKDLAHDAGVDAENQLQE